MRFPWESIHLDHIAETVNRGKIVKIEQIQATTIKSFMTSDLFNPAIDNYICGLPIATFRLTSAKIQVELL
jgi:hypothetical protein